MTSRYVTQEIIDAVRGASSDPTPPSVEMEEERFKLYRLCECDDCHGTGKVILDNDPHAPTLNRCPVCRGEGRILDLVATATDPESAGVALITLGREGEWEGCQFGLLDSEGAKNHKWIVLPWTQSPTARNVSDAARVLAKSKLGRPS
jgi:hypothetical protein